MPDKLPDTPPAEVQPITPQPETPATTTPVETFLPWTTRDNVRHNCRVVMDEYDLTWDEKDLLCAVIEGESGFNIRAINRNRNERGDITSTDWGICQINDKYHIGKGLDFPSVQYVLDNPDKCVEWMIKQYKMGHLNWWCAFQNQSYKRFL